MLVKKSLYLGLASLIGLISMNANADNYPATFVTLGGGWAASYQSHISTNPTYWDAATQGYNDRLGNSAFYSGGLGVKLNPLLSLSLEATERPSFEYQKFQTSSASDTPGFTPSKTRYFDLSNTSLMLNGYLHGQGISDKLVYALCPTTTLQPIVGAGLGLSYNTVKNFHSVAYGTGGSETATSVMNDNTTTSFAWQAMGGLEFTYKQNLGIDVGYRYFDGGNFRSNNYITSATTDNVVTPWKGDLKTNEVFLNLTYNIA